MCLQIRLLSGNNFERKFLFFAKWNKTFWRKRKHNLEYYFRAACKTLGNLKISPPEMYPGPTILGPPRIGIRNA